MKKVLFIGSFCAAVFFAASCDNSQTEQKTHTHEDGSTHADHDTTKPVQQEFVVGDTTKTDTSHQEHTHADGEKHSH